LSFVRVALLKRPAQDDLPLSNATDSIPRLVPPWPVVRFARTAPGAIAVAPRMPGRAGCNIVR